MSPKTIQVTHANLKTPIDLAVALIAGWYWSESHKATHIVAAGGAIFPALESVDVVRGLYNQASMMPAVATKQE